MKKFVLILFVLVSGFATAVPGHDRLTHQEILNLQGEYIGSSSQVPHIYKIMDCRVAVRISDGQLLFAISNENGVDVFEYGYATQRAYHAEFPVVSVVEFHNRFKGTRGDYFSYFTIENNQDKNHVRTSTHLRLDFVEAIQNGLRSARLAYREYGHEDFWGPDKKDFSFMCGQLQKEN